MQPEQGWDDARAPHSLRRGDAGGRHRDRHRPAARAVAAEAVPASRTLAYGADSRQALDYWPGTRADAPLVVFVHGGGWKRATSG